MRYLKHKTYDLIYDHDYRQRSLELFSGHPDEFEALVTWVSKVAAVHGYKLRIRFTKGFNRVTISKVD